VDAQTGIQFLVLLARQGLADKEDIEKAVEIAGSKSPSASFDAAQLAFVLRHGQAVSNGYLAFAKGTRWLAVLRRDSGRKAFEEAVAELVKLVGGRP
jgi:hypothetical protein